MLHVMMKVLNPKKQQQQRKNKVCDYVSRWKTEQET